MINIWLEPDLSVEPGHQVLVLPKTDEGAALTLLLTGVDALWFSDGQVFRIPHDAVVDVNLVKLIDALAHVRYQSPSVVQLTLQETNA